jgi:hypothetical protein
MPEVRSFSEGGREILLIDLSHVAEDGLISQVVADAIMLVQLRSRPGSVRTLLDLTGTHVNRAVRSSLVSLSQQNGRFALATAFVGLNAFWSRALMTMFWMRGKKNHKVFKTRTQAIEWFRAW